jgi:flagellar basal body rod protein FlgG
MDLNAIAAASMQRDMTKFGFISQNIANAATPGYKRQVTVAPAFAAQVQAGLAAAAPAMTAYNDATAGPLRHTGSFQDVALEGPGFLEVLADDGPRYTRHGALRLDARGRLLGPGGLPVMGQQGEIVLANAPFQILPNGEIRQDGRVAGQLKLVQFDQPALLQAAGGGLYAQGRAQPAAQPVPVTLRPGHLEQSNVNTAQEMVALTETVRHFEAMQRLLQGHDESLEKTIRKLGEY